MPQDLTAAITALEHGQLLAMPTETVYGLAGDARNRDAVLRIFKVKGRPHFDPLIVHVADKSMAARYAHINDIAERLMDRFWPGPLTLVLPKTDVIPDEVSSGLDTVAIRCPRHPLALKLITESQIPVAAPSANLFGRVSPTTVQHVRDQLGDEVAVYLDGGPCDVGVESTVLGFDGDRAQILRPGGLSQEIISEALGYQVSQLSVQQLDEHLPKEAPGMLKNHYAPRIPLFIKADLDAWPVGSEIGYLCWSDSGDLDVQRCQILSPEADVDQAAQRLFAAMRQLEQLPINEIWAETVPNHGLGLAINDRLRRAAGID